MTLADKLFAALLLFIPVTLFVSYLHVPAVLLFFCAAIAIVPLAKFIGDATEELTRYVGVAAGGVLNATFGNAPELLIALFALNRGLVEVVKAGIIGSILANLILGLGLAMFMAGLHRREQKFNGAAAQSSASTLLLIILALTMPAIFLITSGAEAASTVETLSIGVSVLLLIAYGASLIFSLWTHRHLWAREATRYMGPQWSVSRCLLVLLATTVATAFMSDVLTGAIEPLITSLGWTQTFIGVVVLALVGNAAEYATAIRVALKDNMALTLQIAIGSASQIAMFVAPLLVISSALFFPVRLDLVFSTFELTALVLSVFVLNSIVEDGESNWFEGLLLIIAYVVVAAAFFLHP